MAPCWFSSQWLPHSPCLLRHGCQQPVSWWWMVWLPLSDLNLHHSFHLCFSQKGYPGENTLTLRCSFSVWRIEGRWQSSEWSECPVTMTTIWGNLPWFVTSFKCHILVSWFDLCSYYTLTPRKKIQFPSSLSRQGVHLWDYCLEKDRRQWLHQKKSQEAHLWKEVQNLASQNESDTNLGFTSGLESLLSALSLTLELRVDCEELDRQGREKLSSMAVIWQNWEQRSAWSFGVYLCLLIVLEILKE